MNPLLFVNGVLSLLAGLALSWVVLNPRINDGVLVKSGLVVSIFALLASAYASFTGNLDATAAFNAGFILRVGIVVACVGVAWREKPWRRVPPQESSK